jgi:hypothetical protein
MVEGQDAFNKATEPSLAHQRVFTARKLTNNSNILSAFPFVMSSLALISSPSTKLISQGAEARVYLAHLQDPPDGPPVLLKHRFKKGYRHASLDASLTKHRVQGEARALLKCVRCENLAASSVGGVS